MEAQRGYRMGERKTPFRKTSDDAAREKTGRGQQEWFPILDASGAGERGHTESARCLREEPGVSPWWAQAVTIRYEWVRVD